LRFVQGSQITCMGKKIRKGPKSRAREESADGFDCIDTGHIIQPVTVMQGGKTGEFVIDYEPVAAFL
jgi:hypothetical protein